MARMPAYKTVRRKRPSLVGRLIGRIRSKPSPSASSPAPLTVTNLRRWDAAKRDRLNQAQLGAVTSNSVNRDLGDYLETLRTRSAHEAANNGIIEGIINTHVTDIVGKQGPSLQIQSDNDDADTRDEEAFAEWWENPDLNDELAGADFLRSWIRMLWIAGEFLSQIVTVAPPPGSPSNGVLTRLYDLHPRRLVTPFDRAFDRNIVLGVKRSDTGKPEEYYIADDIDRNLLAIASLSTDGVKPIKAKDILHGFVRQEPGQARGVPWLAPSLQVIADIRDYDAAVLQAAITAAEQSIALTTDNDELEVVAINESAEIERGTRWFAPPGYQVTQLQPTQPSTKYKDFRRERIVEYGRPVNMPGMMVRLDSSDHNFSSARFDGQLYQRGLSALEGWLERSKLNRLVRLITSEAGAARGQSGAEKKRGRIKYVWTWPVPPHVDPQKEAKAEATRLASGTTTLTDALASHGTNLETHIAKAKRELKLLRDAGLLNVTPTDTSDGDAAPNAPDAKKKPATPATAAVVDKNKPIRSNGKLQAQGQTHDRS